MIEPAIEITEEADIFVVIGTSLNVYPAAGLLRYVRPQVPIYLIDPKEVKVPVDRSVRVTKREPRRVWQSLSHYYDDNLPYQRNKSRPENSGRLLSYRLISSVFYLLLFDGIDHIDNVIAQPFTLRNHIHIVYSRLVFVMFIIDVFDISPAQLIPIIINLTLFIIRNHYLALKRFVNSTGAPPYWTTLRNRV